MNVQDLDQQELIELAELLNEISLDFLDHPLEVIDFTMMKQRTTIVRTLLAIARGAILLEKDLKLAQEFYDEVCNDEES